MPDPELNSIPKFKLTSLMKAPKQKWHFGIFSYSSTCIYDLRDNQSTGLSGLDKIFKVNTEEEMLGLQTNNTFKVPKERYYFHCSRIKYLKIIILVFL